MVKFMVNPAGRKPLCSDVDRIHVPICRWVDDKMIKPQDRKTQQKDDAIILAAKKGDVSSLSSDFCSCLLLETIDFAKKLNNLYV